MTQIYSPFSNGYLRTEKHRVVAKGRSPEDGSDYGNTVFQNLHIEINLASRVLSGDHR